MVNDRQLVEPCLFCCLNPWCRSSVSHLRSHRLLHHGSFTNSSFAFLECIQRLVTCFSLDTWWPRNRCLQDLALVVLYCLSILASRPGACHLSQQDCCQLQSNVEDSCSALANSMVKSIVMWSLWSSSESEPSCWRTSSLSGQFPREEMAAHHPHLVCTGSGRFEPGSVQLQLPSSAKSTIFSCCAGTEVGIWKSPRASWCPAWNQCFVCTQVTSQRKAAQLGRRRATPGRSCTQPGCPGWTGHGRLGWVFSWVLFSGFDCLSLSSTHLRAKRSHQLARSRWQCLQRTLHFHTHWHSSPSWLGL